jgi:hypothetical protein
MTRDENIVDIGDVDNIESVTDRTLAITDRKILYGIRRTDNDDWVKMGKYMYLQSKGAEKFICLGIKISDVRHEKHVDKDDQGAYYIYTFYGTFIFERSSIIAIGTRSSRDKFFAKEVSGELKQLSNVTEPNIKKSAYSNMMVNGITRLLGLRGMTEEKLQNLGLKTNLISNIEFKENTTEHDRVKRKEIAHWLLEMNDTDQASAMKELEALTEFVSPDGKKIVGVTSTDNLRGKRLDFIHNKIKKSYLEYCEKINA